MIFNSRRRLHVNRNFGWDKLQPMELLRGFNENTYITILSDPVFSEPVAFNDTPQAMYIEDDN
jgi:hypothetical protein